MPTIFSKIILGEIPSYKIAENDKFYAFLDINPLAKGHSLVVPKTEVDCYFDLDDDTIQEINLFSKKVAKSIEKIDCSVSPVAPITQIFCSFNQRKVLAKFVNLIRKVQKFSDFLSRL